MIIENLIYVEHDGELKEFFKDLDLTKINKKKLTEVYHVVSESNTDLSKLKKSEIIDATIQNLRAASRGLAFIGESIDDSTEIINRLKDRFCDGVRA
jgi:hypothetical protein